MFQVLFQNATHATILWMDGEFPQEQSVTLEELRSIQADHNEWVPDEECEHGLSAWLCAGPNHYPEGA